MRLTPDLLVQKAITGTRSVLRFIFPPRCVGCDNYLNHAALACDRCKHAVFDIESPQCLVCGQTRQTVGGGYGGVDEICGQCLEKRPHFTRARARWEYSGTIAEALQRAKYRGQLWALRRLADDLGSWLDDQVEQVEQASKGASTLITAVPMHPTDLRRRGFNAALLLARLALPDRRVESSLVAKTKKTPAQAGLARGQRLANLRGAFACPRPRRIDKKRVVLFDDVMTTGATTSEVAKALVGAGASEVVVLTAARTIAS
jgi:ComF family protein